MDGYLRENSRLPSSQLLTLWQWHPTIPTLSSLPALPAVLLPAYVPPSPLTAALPSARWASFRAPPAVKITGVNGITISPLITGGSRYVAIYGTAGANLPGLYYYSYGPGIGAWKNAALGAAPDFVTAPVFGTGAVAYDNVAAFAFSPNFPSDYMAMAVLVDTGTAGYWRCRLPHPQLQLIQMGHPGSGRIPGYHL